MHSIHEKSTAERNSPPSTSLIAKIDDKYKASEPLFKLPDNLNKKCRWRVYRRLRCFVFVSAL